MTNQAAQTMPELPVALASIHADGYWTTDDRRPDWKWPARQRVFSVDQMHQYARDYAAMLAAAPAASGGDEPDPLVIAKELATSIWSSHYREDSPNWEPFDNLAYVLSQISNMVSGMTRVMEPPSATSVSERARALLAAEYRTHGWHEDAGRLCMGGEVTSFVEDDALRVIDRLIEQGDEDNHVITELGRLLAGIAVILKGQEPAGTAWSYHDLPELVASALSEPRQVAAEMKAWAHTKMAEQQSSRRDRMMVAEWAKRLLPESSFPVKDFDVEGMSITKEAAREAVKRVALEQALTQQRGYEPAAWMVEWTDNAGDPTRYIAYCEEDAADKLGVLSDGEAATAKVVPLYTTPQPSTEGLRELVQRWRDQAAQSYADAEEWDNKAGRDPDERRILADACRDMAATYRDFADELESLLARGG